MDLLKTKERQNKRHFSCKKVMKQSIVFLPFQKMTLQWYALVLARYCCNMLLLPTSHGTPHSSLN